MKRSKKLMIYLSLCIMLLFMTNIKGLTQIKDNAFAEAVVSNENPDVGDTLVVKIDIDLTQVQAPDNLMGSFDCSFHWDQSILHYESYLSPIADFMVVENPNNVKEGQIIFSGANPFGIGEKSTILTIAFTLLRKDFSVTALDLHFSAMAAAATFNDLLPILSTKGDTLTAGVTQVNFESGIPKKYDLSNHPNPFNSETIINYELPEKSLVSLKIYNLLGYEVLSLVEEEKESGFYTVNFNGQNLAAGVYFYTLTAGNFRKTQKMLLLK